MMESQQGQQAQMKIGVVIMWIVTYYDSDGNDFFKEFQNATDAYKFGKEIENEYSVLVIGDSYGLHG